MRRLAGMLPSLWEQRSYMVLQTFIDESFDEERFVLVGYLSTPQRWAELSAEWEELLPLVSVPDEEGFREFKMEEIAKSPERISHVPAFYRLIEKHVQQAVSVTFNIADLTSALARIKLQRKTVSGEWVHYPLKIEQWGNPYLFAFRQLVDHLNRHRADFKKLPADQKPEIIADERRDKRPILLSWDEVIGQLPPDEARLFGNIPLFEDSRQFPPLQAADLWAWWVRRWSNEYGPGGVAVAQFPWETDMKIPPKAFTWFDEQWMIEYFSDLIRPSLPNHVRIVVLPR